MWREEGRKEGREGSHVWSSVEKEKREREKERERRENEGRSESAVNATRAPTTTWGITRETIDHSAGTISLPLALRKCHHSVEVPTLCS